MPPVPLPPDIREIITRSPHCGITATFVKLNDEWGIKAYFSGEERDRVYDTQIEYAKYGFAPPVGEKFNVGSYFCYATRVAETLVPADCDPYEFYEKERHFKPMIIHKAREMRNCGLRPQDLHCGNFGFFEGNLVMIDLGMDTDSYFSDYYSS